MRLTVIGCSGSFPGPDSAASCYLVEATGADDRTWRILLDLGSGALGPLQRYTSLYDVDAVLLSHLHPDHCLDLTGLYVALKYRPAGPAPAVPVHGPTGTAGRLAKAYDGLPDTGMSAELDVHEWVAGQPVSIGPFTVTPHRVEHPVEAYGLRVAADGAVLAYTGDTDATPNLGPLCRDADLVLTDSAFVEGRDATRGVHLTARRAGQAATDAGGVRRLVLTHLPPWNDPAVARAEAAQTWAGPLDVAAPGATFELVGAGGRGHIGSPS
jgi:ribonuclease BN (tRNA processing enzyme)